MNIIGLDIGTYSVKAIEVAKTSTGRYQVVNIGKEDIYTGVSGNPDELEPNKKIESTRTAIKRLFDKRKFNTKKVVVSLLGEDVVIRYVKLPFMSKDELKNAIRYEAEQYIPFPMDSVVLDFHILGEATIESQKKLDCILVAVKNEVVNKTVNLVTSVGIDPVIIDCDVFAIQNSYEANYGIKENETVALINIGAKLTSLNIIEDGINRFARDVAFGGNLFTKDISKMFKLDFDASEKLKIESSEIIIESEDVELTRIPDKEDKTFKIFETVISNENKLLAEIRRSFDFYEAQAKKRVVNKVMISGGSSLIKNSDKFLSERLKVSVEYHNPFNKVDGAISEIPSMFVVAFGLAIRGIKGKK